jgi:rRNA maturation endonuclease Nob1
MVDYNEQDVALLERVYMRLRAFDNRPANAGHFFEDAHNEHRCPVCGSDDVEYTGNSVYTPVSEFAEVVCNDCGHRSRTRQAKNSKEKRNSLLITAR